MTTNEQINTLPSNVNVNKKLASFLAKKIIIGVVVTVTVTLIANALVGQIESLYAPDTTV